MSVSDSWEQVKTYRQEAERLARAKDMLGASLCDTLAGQMAERLLKAAVRGANDDRT